MHTLITPPHHRRDARRPGLWWFVLLSVLLHLGLLWGVQREPQPAVVGEAPSRALALRLQPPAPRPAAASRPEPKPSAERRVARPVARQAPASTSVARRHAVEPARAAAPAAAPAAPQQDGHEAPSTADAAAEGRAQQAQILLSLQQALTRHFRYPLLARKRGWQGEVLLAFRLESDGRIIDARIARSSGYGLLDSAALAALGRIQRLEHGVREGMTLQLPVIYRLEG